VVENVEDEGIDEKELIYVGMAGMMGPAKPDVENSIREAFACP
jgi:Ca2+-transporting ATPase